jgi:transposase
VIAIERIDDAATLRQVALLLQKENEKLHDKLRELLRRLAAAEGGSADAQLALELEKLQRQVNALQHQMFGQSSERRDSESKEKPREREAPQKGHGPHEQARLPIKEVEHELAPEDRHCPACDGQVDPWEGQFEESDEVSLVQRQFVILKHKRKKYRCKCNGAVVTAPGPDKLVAGGRYSLEFAVEVAAQKYLDHMPLERQVRVMEREGLVVGSQTLWDQVNALARHLGPAYEALHLRVLESSFVHADETWWLLMNKRRSKKWWSWCLATTDTVYHRILPSRSAEAARTILEGFRGVAITDGFASYQSLARAGPAFTLAHCWAHARREYFEIQKDYPEETKTVLDLIGEMYTIEKLVPSEAGMDESTRADALALRAKLRSERSRLVVDRIREWAYAQRATPESSLRKAIDYMLGLWTGLTRFLDDPRVPLDNNRVERALRPMVVGRKNHYGSRSKRGTEVAALFYSLVETAKLCGVEPKGYLLEAARQAVRHPGSALLPHQLAQ